MRQKNEKNKTVCGRRAVRAFFIYTVCKYKTGARLIVCKTCVFRAGGKHCVFASAIQNGKKVETKTAGYLHITLAAGAGS